MKEIYCTKCGEKYDAKLDKCPKCNEPNSTLFKKKLIKVLKVIGSVILVAMITTTFVLSIINTIHLNTIDEEIAEISYAASSDTAATGSTSEVDLTMMSFYNDYNLTSTTLPEGDDYFLYFHSEDCTYCLQYGNQYVATYWQTGYEKEDGTTDYVFDAIPVYFVTPDTDAGNELFDTFQIDGTPTLIRIQNGEEVARGDGYDEVATLLAEAVNTYYGQ